MSVSMSTFLLSTLALSFLALLFYYLFPLLQSPLSRLPNAHFSVPFSTIWILWHRIRDTEIQAIHAAHQKNGPIVRLGPNDVSVNVVSGGLKTIYGLFPKHDFYSAWFQNYDKPNMFSTIGNREHSERKRAIGTVYRKSTLQNSTEIAQIFKVLIARALSVIDASVACDENLDILELSYAISMDFISAYQFGLQGCSNFLGDASRRKRWIHHFMILRDAPTWSSDHPVAASILGFLGFDPLSKFMNTGFDEVSDIGLRLLKTLKARVASNLAEEESTRAVVYEQLAHSTYFSPRLAERSTEINLDIASEMMDHLDAGSDTMGITLTYTFYELSKNQDVMAALRAEVRAMSPVFQSLATGMSASSSLNVDASFFRELENLALLDAIALESLRRHPAVPGSQPRVTPASGTNLVGYFIPGGVRVSAQAYSLHRNEDVFPESEKWKPERWLNAQTEEKDEMMRWFWGFGSGPRGCIGRDFALLEYKLIVASICANYVTEIVDDWDLFQKGGFEDPPDAKKLFLKFGRADDRVREAL